MFREKPYLALIEPEPVEESSRFRFSRFPSKQVEKPVYMKGADCTEFVPEVCGLQDTKLPGQPVRNTIILNGSLQGGEVAFLVANTVSNCNSDLLTQTSFLEDSKPTPTTVVSFGSEYYPSKGERFGITTANHSIVSSGGSMGLLETIEKHTREMLKHMAIDPRFLVEDRGSYSTGFRSSADNEPFAALKGKTAHGIDSERSKPESKSTPYPEGALTGQLPAYMYNVDYSDGNSVFYHSFGVKADGTEVPAWAPASELE